MSITLYCTVCGRALVKHQQHGNRPYCDIHLELFTQDMPPLWRASSMAIGLMVAMVVGIAIANPVLEDILQSTLRLIAGIAIAGLPPLVWLASLYRAARRVEVGLSPLLLTIFVLAALVAAALTRPFLYELIDLDTWLWRTNTINRLVGNILLGGFTHAFVLYTIVRYTVWHTAAFTRRVDGVLYATAAGWGYASMFGLLFVLDRDGISLMNGGYRLIAQTCALVASSAIIGYFLGYNRFEDMPFYYLSSGVAIAAALNGFLLFAGNELNNIRLSLTQDGFSPWPGLVLNMLVFIITLAAIYGLFKRQNGLTRTRLGLDKAA